MSFNMQSRQGVSHSAAFFILIGLLGVGLFLGSLAAAGIWVASTGKGIFSMEKEMLDPSNVQVVRWLQFVSTLIIFMLPAVITAWIMNRKPFSWLGFHIPFSFRQALLVLGIMAASLPVVGALSELNKIIPIPAAWEKMFRDLEDTYNSQVEVLSNIKGPGDYVLSLLIMALAPALFEETFFRGGMQQILTRWMHRPLPAIIITSMIFSIIHFSWFGFLPRFLLGIVLGLIFFYSGSLWLAILAHMFNNALVVTQIYLESGAGRSVEDIMNESWPLWTGFVGGIVLVALLYLFYKVSARERRKHIPAEEIALEEKWIA